MNILNLFKTFFLLIVLIVPQQTHAEQKREGNHLKNLDVYSPENVPDLPFYGNPADEGEELIQRRLEDFKGKLVVLNFWATWCIPCRLEMPSLNQMQKEMGEEHDIVVVTISEDFTGMPAVLKFFEENKLENLKPYIDDRNQLFGSFGVRNLPTTIFINKKGKEIARIQGEVNWNAKEVRDFIKSLL